MSAASRPQPELMELFKETVALYLRLTADAASIHGLGQLSGPRRTLLIALADAGPQTVAHLARSRSQARQRLQPLINALAAEGFVETVPNPVHKLSPLIVLTKRGHQEVERIRSAEGALLSELKVPSTPKKLTDSTIVLREVRLSLESQMPALLAGSRSGRPRVPRRSRSTPR